MEQIRRGRERTLDFQEESHMRRQVGVPPVPGGSSRSEVRARIREGLRRGRGLRGRVLANGRATLRVPEEPGDSTPLARGTADDPDGSSRS
jgi:hypothetical protein